MCPPEACPLQRAGSPFRGETKTMIHPALLIALVFPPPAAAAQPPEDAPMPQTVRREAADTLTALELNCGDTLTFALRSGETRTLVVGRATAAVLERVEPGGVVYHFTCGVTVDGHRLRLERYVCSQECFYEPYVVNGMRIWLDAVRAVTDMIPLRDIEAQRTPRKYVRLAVQDATLPDCPQKMGPWYPNDKNAIDVGDCYNGDDCWLGPYLGKACHGGLDINHAKGEPLWAPIDVDDHWLFNSLAAGHNNNRWRGVRTWPNGDTWTLQTHHLVKMLVPEHKPLKRGVQYATAAGVHVGSHQHTHYVFKVRPRQGGPEIHLDPWILFWQIFETRRAEAGEIRAAMAPLSPAKTGEAVGFSAAGSHAGKGAGQLTCRWTFGDGGFATGPGPRYAFARPGVYPVTLVVDDGIHRAARTQHITVDGPAVAAPALALGAPDEPGFRLRPVHAMDAYATPPRARPHTLRLAAAPNAAASGGPAGTRTIALRNLGKRALAPAKVTVRGEPGAAWLRVSATGAGNRQALAVRAEPAGLAPGRYAADVTVACPGALNSPQRFGVELTVRPTRRARTVIVDDRDDGFAATPYFWVGHRFCRAKRRGHAGRYLTNGARARKGAFARFTPDLDAGRYEVSFHEKTPFAQDAAFDVRVRHAAGETVVRARPARSRVLGTFDFREGTGGYVELLAEGAAGLVVADAVVFRRAD